MKYLIICCALSLCDISRKGSTCNFGLRTLVYLFIYLSSHYETLSLLKLQSALNIYHSL